MTLRVSVQIEGVEEISRALARVPREGRTALVKRSGELAYNLVRRQRRSAASSSRQARRAAGTLRVVRGRLLPTIQAGPHPLLFGSEFGVLGRFGWYSAGRYRRSAPRQFKPWRQGSYWFFEAAERATPVITQAWAEAADDVIRSWRA